MVSKRCSNFAKKFKVLSIHEIKKKKEVKELTDKPRLQTMHFCLLNV